MAERKSLLKTIEVRVLDEPMRLFRIVPERPSPSFEEFANWDVSHRVSNLPIPTNLPIPCGLPIPKFLPFAKSC